MPPHIRIPSLVHHAADTVAKKLHDCLIRSVHLLETKLRQINKLFGTPLFLFIYSLDSIWSPPPLISAGSTPTSSPSTSPINPRSSILPPLQISDSENIDVLRRWLFELPIHLVEEVIRIGEKVFNTYKKLHACNFFF